MLAFNILCLRIFFIIVGVEVFLLFLKRLLMFLTLWQLNFYIHAWITISHNYRIWFGLFLLVLLSLPTFPSLIVPCQHFQKHLERNVQLFSLWLICWYLVVFFSKFQPVVFRWTCPFDLARLFVFPICFGIFYLFTCCIASVDAVLKVQIWASNDDTQAQKHGPVS